MFVFVVVRYRLAVFFGLCLTDASHEQGVGCLRRVWFWEAVYGTVLHGQDVIYRCLLHLPALSHV